jgi:hypothetical protein
MERRTGKGPSPRSNARTSRDEWLLREVRSRMTKRAELVPERLRRLERMEHAARVWVNGQEVGGDSKNGYPHDVDG